MALTLPSIPGVNPTLVRHALRTAVAAGLTLLVAEALGFQQGFWAAITSVIVMQVNLGRSLDMAWARVLGTLAGAIMATLLGQLIGTGPFALGVAVFLTFIICSAIPFLRQSFRIAGITVPIILSHGIVPGDLWAVGLERFLEITLGVAVAMVVSVTLLPMRARRSLRAGLAQALELNAELLAAVFDDYMRAERHTDLIEDLKERRLKVRFSNRTLMDEAHREPGGLGRRDRDLIRFRDFEIRTFRHLQSMDHALENVSDDGYHLNLESELTRLARTVQTSLNALSLALAHEDEITGLEGLAGLRAAMDEADNALLALRERHVHERYELRDMINFFNFYEGMRAIARDGLILTGQYETDEEHP